MAISQPSKSTLYNTSSSHPDPADYRYDVLVIGAGILGCTAAVSLARQGRRTLLLERSFKEPDRIVGELLQPGGVAALAQLGMSDCLEGIDAVPVRGYHIYYREEGVTFWYPPVPVEGKNVVSSANLEKDRSGEGREKRKPEGRSFHHGKFLMKLRDTASREPKVTMVETTAMELVRHEKTTQVVGVKCLSGGKNWQCVCVLFLFTVYRLEILYSDILFSSPLISQDLTLA
jgi:squalene monooxygenase